MRNLTWKLIPNSVGFDGIDGMIDILYSPLVSALL